MTSIAYQQVLGGTDDIIFSFADAPAGRGSDRFGSGRQLAVSRLEGVTGRGGAR